MKQREDVDHNQVDLLDVLDMRTDHKGQPYDYTPLEREDYGKTQTVPHKDHLD